MGPLHPAATPARAPRGRAHRSAQVVALEAPVPSVALAREGQAHQNITYSLVNGARRVGETPIDLAGALREMEGLTHGIENFICLTDHGAARDGFVQFLRLGEDRWYADIPIDMGVNWSGYVWGCETPTRPLVDTLRLFFAGSPWFGVLPWTMRRV